MISRWFDKKIEVKNIDSSIYKKKNIKFLDYQYFASDEDEEMMDKEQEILEYFVDDNMGMGFCQGQISQQYIKEAFETNGMIGKIMTIGKDGLYVGFILFSEQRYKGRKALYLSLLCAVSSKVFVEKKGIPVGALLLKEFEKYAKENKYKLIFANAVSNALPFYEKNNWETVENKYVRKFKKFFINVKENEVPILKKIKIKKIKKKMKGGSKKRCSKILKSGDREGKKCNRLNCKYHK